MDLDAKSERTEPGVSVNSTTGCFSHESVSPGCGENIFWNPADTNGFLCMFPRSLLGLGSSTHPEGTKGLGSYEWQSVGRGLQSRFPTGLSWELCNSATYRTPSGNNKSVRWGSLPMKLRAVVKWSGLNQPKQGASWQAHQDSDTKSSYPIKKGDRGHPSIPL